MLRFFGLNKIQTFFDIIKFHGGFKNAMLLLARTDDLKIGKLVGVDKFGNKYYENNQFFVGRNRWVVYSDKFGYDYDASQVSPEWFGWLHYKTDLLPQEDKSRPHYKWMAEQTDNPTGTPLQYVPYSTTKPKVQAWVPPNLKK